MSSNNVRDLALETLAFLEALEVIRRFAAGELADVEEGLAIPDVDPTSETAKSLRAYLIGKKEVWQEVVKITGYPIGSDDFREVRDRHKP